MLQVQETPVPVRPASTSWRGVPRDKHAAVRVAGGWFLLLLAILLLLLIRSEFTSWLWMWLVAFTLYGGFKLLTVLRLDGESLRRLSGGRLAAYLLLWPGMKPQSFFQEAASAPTDQRRLWVPGVGYVLLGMILLWSGVTSLLPTGIGVWVGMFGFVFLLHFGLFDLLASVWRRVGVPVERLFDNPWRSMSLAEFWGSRWNRSFSALSRDLILRPLARLTGARWAGFAVFLFSGLVHELVISVPARGGYGGPLLYFGIQGLLVLAEGTSRGRGLRQRHPRLARGATLGAVFGLLPLLFPALFRTRVVVPLLQALGVAGLS